MVIASRFNYLTREEWGNGRSPSEEVHSGVRFAWLDTGTYRKNDRSRIRSMLSYLARASVAGLRAKNRPDIVLASSPHLLAGVAGALVAAWHRVPFVFEVRDLWPAILVDLGAIRSGSWAHRALEMLERWLYRRARLVIFVPPQGQRRLAELGLAHKHSIHIPNGADLLGEAEALPDTLESMMSSLEGRRVLMYTGAHGIANDLATVIRALDELRVRWPAVYEGMATVFIGDGSEKPALARLIEAGNHTAAFMHSPVSKAAIPAALRHADALLVSVAPAVAHSYGLSPNKLYDYMAAGRPVLVASHVPTLADVSGAGVRYEPGDAVGLAEAIVSLFTSDETERTAMGTRARTAVEQEFGLEAVADRLEASLNGILNT